MPLFTYVGRAHLFTLGAIFVLAGNGLAQLPSYSAGQTLIQEAGRDGIANPSKATVVKMTIHAAVAPVPALKYQLLPEVPDLKPGNAALLYQRAHSTDWWFHFIRNNESEKIANFLDMPLRKMPRERGMLLAGPLREMDLAARREYCDWELTPRLREEGYSLLIPDVQGFRTFGQMLALRARLDMLDGQFDQTVTDLQTGFALSRHVSEAPCLVNSLVGMAIGESMFSQLEEFVQLDKAPNLYWALADLPRPFIDLRRPMQGEKLGITSIVQDIHNAIRNPSQSPIPVQTLNKYLENLRQVSAHGAGTDFRFFVTLMAARSFPAGKEYLRKHGFAAEQIDAMPVTQVALMYALALLEESYDEVYKWQGFPYWQARPGIAKARKLIDQMVQDQGEAMFLARDLTPAVDKVMFTRARTDRRVAMLQIVEAVRLHAAEAGKLPEHLEDIHAVPVPIDPVTGKAFQYTLEQNRAILYAPPPAGEAAAEENALRYELTLAPATK
jgi:hypothetical protein